MRLKRFFYAHKNALALLAVILPAFAIYCSSMTKSGLWYDEAVEYFCSKYKAPWIQAFDGTEGLFARVLCTYQPPLYNVLMRIWLLVYDSEAWYHLAGVLTAMAGSIGVYCTLKEICPERGAPFAGAAVYLCTRGVAYYALECGEYNLMMALEAWAVCFFVRSLLRRGRRSLALFFLFSSLAVWAQYGAAFMAAGMFLVLLCSYARGAKEERRSFFLCTRNTVCIAVIPLVSIFMLRQAERQGSAYVSHFLHFRYGDIFSDFFRGIWTCICAVFVTWDKNIQQADALDGLIISAAVFLFCAAAVPAIKGLRANGRPKGPAAMLFLAFFSAYVLYYFATAANFYGYNGFAHIIKDGLPKSGTENLGLRYCMFMAPVFAVLAGYGISCIGRPAASVTKKPMPLYRQAQKHLLSCLSWFMIAVFLASGCYSVIHGWEKDDVREAVQAWMEEDLDNAGNNMILVHEWSDPSFRYYFYHYNSFDENLEQWEVINTDADGSTRYIDADGMDQRLSGLGVYEYGVFYYIGPVAFGESYEAFLEAVQGRGYNVTVVYKGRSALLLCEKQG